MSIESQVPVAHTPEPVAAENKAADQVLDQQQQQQQDTTGVDGAVAALAISQPPADLHRACAEGRLDDVRAVLGRSLDALETLDIVTGCTPIVLAIQNGHVDVVRELLSAGAVVPPPGLTGDPAMLSVLYPQPLYAPPPPFAQMAPPQFYHQPGFYQPAGAVHYPPRKESNANGAAAPNGAANGAANLPPTEVAKTIPCRNFPNCKYGASCIFFHPRPQPGFFPGAPAGYYDPAAGGFVPYPAGAAPFFPGAPQFVPGASADDAAAAPATSESTPADAAATTPHDSIPAQSPGAAHVPSAVAPAFVPGAIPVPNGDAQAAVNGAPFIGSPPAGYAIGPLSPTLIPHSPPPADAAYFATSPPQFQPFIPNGYPGGPGRRQSFGQQFAGGPKPFHGKKPSFSGGSKPWGPGGRPGGSSHLGQWKDGNPPPCAFFREGKCRNGEYCKFPHIDADGADVRHPDVVRGLIPPMPTRPPRVMRSQMINGHYQQHAPYLHNKANAAANSTTVAEVPAEAEAAAAGADGADASSTKDASDKAEGSASVSGSATLPPKPSGSPLPPATGRSASQPGVARVHANGVASRSHSPNGVRRGPRYPNGQANGSRSSSASGEKKPAAPQRIPRADEFPALGINGGAATPSTERREPSWGSKTAAQVLSEPAPPKPASPVSAEAEDKPAEKVVEEVTMDSDSEQDAVIVSVSTTPNPEVAKAKLAAAAASSVSFATVASAVITATGPDATPVALKA